MRKLLFALLLIIAIILPPARAAAAGGMTISPSYKEVVISPGDEQATFEITLTNHDEMPVSARLTAVDFKSLDESGGVAFAGLKANAEETKYGLSAWLGFSKDAVTLGPGQSEKVTVIIDNRESLGPGGHYGAVVVTPLDSGMDSGSSRVEILPATATLVLAKKLGGEIYALNLNQVTLNRKLLGLTGQVTLRFQNTGNVHAVPRGSVTVYDPRGSLVQKAIINPDSGAVLPETFRKYTSTLTKVGRAWWPGRYRAEVAWRFDGQEEFTREAHHFWYAGQAVLILPAVLLALFGLILWITRQKKTKKTKVS